MKSYAVRITDHALKDTIMSQSRGLSIKETPKHPSVRRRKKRNDLTANGDLCVIARGLFLSAGSHVPTVRAAEGDYFGCYFRNG